MAPLRLLALSTVFLGLYFAFRFELHQTPAIQENFKAPAAALWALYISTPPQDFTDESPEVVVEQGPQEVFTSVTPPSSSSARTPFTRHIVAVGDLHGDIKNAQTVLQFSGVVDEHGNWTGDADFFVQTGDIIDRRGDDTIKLFFWMERLRAQAAATGGVVLSHLGNHEIMNAIVKPHLVSKRYVYPSEINTFGSVAARQKMISTGRIGRAWAQNYTATSRLPMHPHLGPPNTPFPPEDHVHFRRDDDDEDDHSRYYDASQPLSHSALSFVHGGLSPKYSNLAPFPTKINALSSSFLSKLQNRVQPPPHPPHPYPGLPHGTTREEAELYDANGPFWYRGWATDSEEKACVDVDKVLARTGTRRMIMGHTPDFTGIVSRCNGKIIIIDTGISHAYGGALSALSIHYTFTPIGDDEDGEPRWTEREVVSALYVDRQETIIDEERAVVGHFRMA
ncbi:Metallo-dependent phosphatase-like protein [Mycena maculata]|uniref:Metallo-dependent phosphatase-like protein n=1 Tax=Mycena maculata TaxID=230809 RepID=A0AAD7JG82_9AGAR|nr:Metallo-dependent phosphatase-like protein [Mycena maculata]